MPDASFVQTNFYGGEWAPYMSGRYDDQRYATALARCLNAYPTEEAVCVRRPGTAFIGTTRKGAAGRLITFDFTAIDPVNMEFTDGHLRFISGTQFVMDQPIFSVVNISTQSPSVVTISSPASWVDGDEVAFLFNSLQQAGDCNLLFHRQFEITFVNALDGTQFTLTDPVTGAAVDLVNWNMGDTLQVGRITDIATPYFASQYPNGWPTSTLRSVQAEDQTVLLQGDVAPHVLTATPNLTAPQLTQFDFSTALFSDGPYLDPVTGSQLSPSALTGIITASISYEAWSSTVTYALGEIVTYAGIDYKSAVTVNVNNTPSSSSSYWTEVGAGSAVGPNGFVSTDVGRLVRMFSEPAAWSGATGYSAGDNVSYVDGNYYTALSANSGVAPNSDLNTWALNPTAAGWTWGRITSVVSSTSVDILIQGADLLYTSVITTWQLGVYSDTTGYPTCGCYHQGRLWLAGAVANRIDASNSNDLFNFAPTAYDGTVGDGNSIAAVFDATGQNTIYWMQPTARGIVCGTAAGEWLVTASALNDPLSPTSIQAHRVSRYRCANVPPVLTPLAILMVERQQRNVFEFLADVFSGKYSAPVLSVAARHLTTSGIQELAYQEVVNPIVWCRCLDGTVIGCTYRRVSAFASENPQIYGWHRHALGSGRTIESIVVGPSPNATTENLWMITTDSSGVRHIEVVTQLFDQNGSPENAWFVDDAVTPTGTEVSSDQTSLTLYGYWHLNGKTVSVWAGMDVGDFVVSNGAITVPFNATFTLAYWNGLINSGATYMFASPTSETVTTVPNRVPENGTIMTYIDPNHINFEGTNQNVLPVDWVKGVLYETRSGVTIDIMKFDIASGQELGIVTASAFTGSLPGWSIYCMGFDGYLYAGSQGSDTGAIAKIDPDTGAVIGQYGPSGPLFNGLAVGSMAPAIANGTNFAVAASLLSNSGGTASGQVQVLDMDAMTLLPFSVQTDEQYAATVVAGPQMSGSSTTYAMCAKPTSGAGYSEYALYSLTISYPTSAAGLIPTTPTITWAKIAKIAATAIDSEWVNGHGNEYPLFIIDGLDGNILMGVSAYNPAVGAQAAYIVKISVADGSIIWKTPVKEFPSFLPMSRVNGWLSICVSDPPNYSLVYVIDTVTGASSSYNVSGLVAFGAQVCDSVNGYLIGTMDSYNPAVVNAPSAVGGYTQSQGSFSYAWGRFAMGDMFKGNSSATTKGSVPIVAGFTFTTQGQLLRPAAAQPSGAGNGPGFGKLKRQHWYAIQVQDAQGVSIGTDFSALYPASFAYDDGTLYGANELYSGIWRDTLSDDYGLDSQLCWQVSRPYPSTVCAFGGFINAQDL